MIKNFIKLSLTAVLFLLLVSSIVFFQQSRGEAQFALYNPFLFSSLWGQLFSYSSVPNPYTVTAPQANYTQGSSYQDYYAAYPYLQLSNAANGSGYGASAQENYGPYIANSGSYIPGPSVSAIAPVVYNQQYRAYQYTGNTASNTYQTVPLSYNTGSNSQQPNYQTAIGTAYNQNYPVAANTYVPVIQGTYTPYPYAYTSTNYTVPNAYTQYQPQYQSTNYFPANTTTYPQASYSGYYVPNANYWPNADATQTDTATTVDPTNTQTDTSTTVYGHESCGGSSKSSAQIEGMINR